jgi:hypothetical protein
LEDKHHLKEVKQEKRNYDFGTFIAYRLPEWEKIKRRTDIFRTRHHLPISGYEMIQPDEKLIIVCIPTRLASRIYQEVQVLRFDETMTEEEKLAKLLAPAAPAANAAANRGPPPPGYRCHNCGEPGHYRNQCKNERRLQPKGIPKMFLAPALSETQEPDILAAPESVYVMEDGTRVKAKLHTKNTMFDVYSSPSGSSSPSGPSSSLEAARGRFLLTGSLLSSSSSSSLLSSSNSRVAATTKRSSP